MRIIGITGKSGSGKSTLTQRLSEELKCHRIDVDKIGHKATSDEKNTEKLCEIFGNGILSSKGNIDRKKLGNIVFSDKEKMDLLTDITWGYMQQMLDKILYEEAGEVIILEWALLPISKYWQKCDTKILIQAKEDEIRKNMVIQRDNISEEYFSKRESGSIDYSSYVFDYIFENDYQVQTIEQMVKVLIKK